MKLEGKTAVVTGGSSGIGVVLLRPYKEKNDKKRNKWRVDFEGKGPKKFGS